MADENIAMDLQREIRSVLVERMRNLEEEIRENRRNTTEGFFAVDKKLETIQGMTAKAMEVNELSKRVRQLEDFRLKTITIIAGVQLLFGVVLTVLLRVLK